MTTKEPNIDPYLLHLTVEFEDHQTLANACRLHAHCRATGAKVPSSCRARIDRHINDLSETYNLADEASQQARLGRIYIMRNLLCWVQNQLAAGCLDLDHAFSFIASDLKDNPDLPSWSPATVRTYYFKLKRKSL